MKILTALGMTLTVIGQANAQPADTGAAFKALPQAYALKGGVIREASGIAASRANPGCLWVQEDSGNPPLLHLIKTDGTIIGKVNIKGALNRDWEDMTLAGGKIYIADIGDNNARYRRVTIYRFDEPEAGVTRVDEIETIQFRYADTAHDAEALFVDSASQDIYIITKRDERSRVYKLAHPQDTIATDTAVLVMELPYNSVVSAAVSPDALELVIKTYNRLYYYKRKKDESWEDVLRTAPANLPYVVEPQGEAIAFSIDNNGFYTLSESVFGIVPKLNFYRRN